MKKAGDPIIKPRQDNLPPTEKKGNEAKDIRGIKRDKWEVFFHILSYTATIGLIATAIGYTVYLFVKQ
jgi:hypothetical protein